MIWPMLWMTMTFYDENIAFEEKKAEQKAARVYISSQISFIYVACTSSRRGLFLSLIWSGEFPPTKTFFQREQPVIPSHKRNEYTDVTKVPEPFWTLLTTPRKEHNTCTHLWPSPNTLCVAKTCKTYKRVTRRTRGTKSGSSGNAIEKSGSWTSAWNCRRSLKRKGIKRKGRSIKNG